MWHEKQAWHCSWSGHPWLGACDIGICFCPLPEKLASTILQLGNLLKLAPIDLSGASLPAVGVPPLDVPGLLGVQFLGFSIANFSSTANADLSVSIAMCSLCMELQVVIRS
jgi:hypothetical protein